MQRGEREKIDVSGKRIIREEHFEFRVHFRIGFYGTRGRAKQAKQSIAKQTNKKGVTNIECHSLKIKCLYLG